MTPVNDILTAYVNLLWVAFQFDYMVFSEKLWIYYWLCIPAFAYLFFFIIKWAVLTFPVWYPPYAIVSRLRVPFQRKPD